MPRNAKAVEIEPRSDDQLGAGEYYFLHHDGYADPAGIIHGCPCGCGGRSAIFFPGGSPQAGNQWQIVAPFPEATLSPIYRHQV